MRGSALAALAALLLVACGKSFAAPADELRALLEQGRPADAYALGRSRSEELGKPEFDFYYGVAALDSGHAGEGVLALERYVVRFPDNDRARLELARGSFRRTVSNSSRAGDALRHYGDRLRGDRRRL